jgi:hypothetical protein
LENVTLIYDDTFADSDIVTNAVNHTFYKGSENVVVGKLLDQEFSLKIQGFSAFGLVEKEIRIPAKEIEPVTEPPPENDEYAEYSEGPIVTTPKPPPKISNYQRLWAFFTIKKLLSLSDDNKIKSVLVPKNSKKFEKSSKESAPQAPTREEIALRLAKKYHFVTKLTSMVITKNNIQEENLSESDYTDEAIRSVDQMIVPKTIISK